VGWRVWDVVEVEGMLRLSSVVYREIWEPGAELKARCRRSLAAHPWARMPLHEPPNADCCCGIYAIRSPRAAAVSLGREVTRRERPLCRVLGTVALWGRVVEASHGWRAQLGYPTALFVPTGTRRRLAAAALWPYRLSPGYVAHELEEYGVPVELFALNERREPPDPLPATATSLGRTTLD
jgi:hypothetical protein